MKPIKAIFFDLGNVIVNFDVAKTADGYKSCSKARIGDLPNYIQYSENSLKYQEGKLTSSQFYDRTRKIFKMSIKFAEFYEIWNRMFYSSPEVETIIRNIRRTYPDIKLVLVSDTNKAHFEYVRSEYNILDLMDAYILSYEVGKRKPHSDMFKKALKAAGSIPSETFYTDDREDLINGARVMGIRAFQFTGYEELKNRLIQCGITA